jgi:phosphinothricin acetyltransferase
MIRKIVDSDAQAILEIYRQGMESRNATFETDLPAWEKWISTKLPHSRFAYIDGIWTLTASIFPENEASLALHLDNGFRLVGRRERIGKLDGVWRDTLILERRSPRIT